MYFAFTFLFSLVYTSDVFAPSNRRKVTEKGSEIVLQMQNQFFRIQPAVLFIPNERNT